MAEPTTSKGYPSIHPKWHFRLKLNRSGSLEEQPRAYRNNPCNKDSSHSVLFMDASIRPPSPPQIILKEFQGFVLFERQHSLYPKHET